MHTESSPWAAGSALPQAEPKSHVRLLGLLGMFCWDMIWFVNAGLLKTRCFSEKFWCWRIFVEIPAGFFSFPAWFVIWATLKMRAILIFSPNSFGVTTLIPEKVARKYFSRVRKPFCRQHLNSENVQAASRKPELLRLITNSKRVNGRLERYWRHVRCRDAHNKHF